MRPGIDRGKTDRDRESNKHTESSGEKRETGIRGRG